MAEIFSLYDRVVRVTHIYLGPAADRFIDRQVQNHLSKSPQELTANDLALLIDWIKVAVSLLTEDKEIIEEYVEQLRFAWQTTHDQKQEGYRMSPSGTDGLVRGQTPFDKLPVAEERARAEALFMSIGDGAITTDEFGKITRVNPAALKILGYKERDVLGQWFPHKIIAVDEFDEPLNLIDRPITQTFLSGKSVSRKMYYRTNSGTVIPVSVTTAPIILDKRPIGAIEVFRDISVENEIDRMKSEFISLASHQLRTPLSAIKTYSHMLIDGFMGDLEPAQRKALQTVVISTNRMNELISTLLNITRIESGSISVAPKPTNIHKLAEEVIKELSHTAEAKSITLNLVLATNDSIVRTDGLIVKEIIANLASNAIKYTPEHGTVTIKLSGRGQKLVISVQDTGMGIPEPAHAQIFTKFFRAPNVVRRETSGTGLGLYLVKGLVDQLGAKIWFKSAENQGSTFYVSLLRDTSKPKTNSSKRHLSTKPVQL